MLSFVLAESALELVPKELLGRPAVVSDARRRGAEASGILLDRSFHHSAMVNLRDTEKRGRPDLVHQALLSVTGTPLYLDGGVRLFVHTCSDLVLVVKDRTRIPKNYFRFRGLMEQVLSKTPQEGLVAARQGDISSLIRKTIRPDLVLGLTIRGRPSSFEDVAGRLSRSKNPCVLVGGFPHGHFSGKTLETIDDLLRVDSRGLEAHVVGGRIVYEVEKLNFRSRNLLIRG